MATIPKPAPAAKPDRSGLRSQEERTTPPIAAAKPTSCSALGRSPVARPTATGIAAPAPAIGATMLMAPTAMPR